MNLAAIYDKGAPEGWALVPTSPTDKMTEAAFVELSKFGFSKVFERMWKAAIFAAPEPPK